MPNSTISAAEFLVPTALRATQMSYRNVLICGSCMAHVLVHFLKYHTEGVKFTHVFMNNLVELPEAPPQPAGEYDFQVVALPLRDIVSDQVVSFQRFSNPEFNQEIRKRALQVLRLMFKGSMKYNERDAIPTMVLGFVAPVVPVSSSMSTSGTDQDFADLVRELNRELSRLVAACSNAVFIDVDAIYSAIGKRHLSEDIFGFYSHGTFFWDEHWKHDREIGYNAPQPGRIDDVPRLSEKYGCETDAMISALWAQFDAAYRVINQLDTVKLVIFDLDDTLWRGQIAEHYGDEGNWPVIDGWPLGVWEAIQHLRARGILVAIASKNEVSLVEDRWDRAIRENWLSLSDFVFKEINWAPKSDNIKRIIELASLTPKSVVFVDDNPVERESVKAALPGIRVIGSNPFETKRILLWSPETQRLNITNESRSREEMMHKQVVREKDREALSRDDFLISLNCHVVLSQIKSPEDGRLGRSLELLNKTNQFNTTGKRWKIAEVNSFLIEGGTIYSFEVSDKYTDYGLVGVVLYKSGHFEQFAMSCRVLGLGVESSVLSTIVKSKIDQGESKFTASVVKTDANIVCRDVFEKIGMIGDIDKQHLPELSQLTPEALHLKITKAEFA